MSELPNVGKLATNVLLSYDTSKTGALKANYEWVTLEVFLVMLCYSWVTGSWLSIYLLFKSAIVSVSE